MSPLLYYICANLRHLRFLISPLIHKVNDCPGLSPVINVVFGCLGSKRGELSIYLTGKWRLIVTKDETERLVTIREVSNHYDD